MCVCVEELVHLAILHCGCGEFNFTIAQAQTAPNKMSITCTCIYGVYSGVSALQGG